MKEKYLNIAALKLSDIVKNVNPHYFQATLKLSILEIIEVLIYAHISTNKIILKRDKNFLENYSRMINGFAKEFSDRFCNRNGSINWEKLVRFNSAERE